jgi:predicted ATPase/class 3 adenylate cyclase
VRPGVRNSTGAVRPISLAGVTSPVGLVPPTTSSVTADEVAVDLAAYVPRIAVEWLRDTPERRWMAPEGTVVFCDVTGFTPMAEKLSTRGRVGAEELTDILNDVFGRLLGVAARQGGDLLKFGGDALLLLFTGPNHAKRACAAAQDMQGQLRAFRRFRTEAGMLSLTMSAGVASGPCHLYLVGASHRELMVTGPVFSRAVELEAAAGSGDVLLSMEVAQALPEASVGGVLGSGVLLERAPQPPQHRPADERRADDSVLGAALVPIALREHLRVRRTEGEHRFAVLTFLQFQGAGRLLEQRGPDAVAAALDDLVRSVQHACETHDVAFLATDIDGDGGKILLCAGAPRATPRDEDAMLHALEEVVSQPRVLAVRAGVNVGRAFAVDVGSPARRTFAVMGDATNLAARVMGKAALGQVVATRAVTDRTHAAFALQPLEPFRVKGKSELVHGCVVGRALLGASASERVATEMALIGRSGELQLLLERLQEVRDGAGQVVELTGEPGIGKSRLLLEVARRANNLPRLYVEASQYLAATPYLALRAPMRLLLGVEPNAEDATVERALTATVTRQAPHLVPMLPLIALPHGIELPDTEVTAAIAPEFRRDRLNDAIDDFIEIVYPGAVLLLVDDAQWIDDASSGLLQRLMRRLPERPWLIVLARRAEGRGLRVDTAPHVTVLELGPLLPDAGSVFVSAAAGGVPMAPHVRRTLVERGAGNPLFLAELVHSTVAGSDPECLPDSIEATVAAAVDEVPVPDRDYLRLAAVLGRRFSVDLLQRMLAADSDGRRECDAALVLDRLSRFLTVENDQVRFNQGLIRDVAYEGLSFRRRRLLHGRAGDLLLTQSAPRDELADLLSVHYSVAGRHEACWEWARLAAARARRAAAPVEAAVHLRRAVEAARHVPVNVGEVARAWEDLGDVCVLVGRQDEARTAYAAARRLWGNQVLERAALHIKEGRLRTSAGRFSASLRWYSNGLRLLRHAPDSVEKLRLEARLRAYAAGSRMDQGQWAKSLPLLERAVQLAAVTADRSTMAYAYYLLEWAHGELGNAQAKEFGALAQLMYQGLEDWQGLAKALNQQGVNAYYAGHWREAVELYQEYYEALQRSGDLVFLPGASHNIAEVLSDQGHLEEAERRFREAIETWRASNYVVGIAVGTSNLARVMVRQGRSEEAGPLYAEARARFGASGAEAYVLETDAREAERLLHLHRPAGAFALAERVRARLGSGPGRVSAAGGQGVLVAMLERLAGCALMLWGQPAEGLARLRMAATAARGAEAAFELALTLDALAVIGPSVGMSLPEQRSAAVEAKEIFERLDVVAVARPPLSPGSQAVLVTLEALP